MPQYGRSIRSRNWRSIRSAVRYLESEILEQALVEVQQYLDSTEYLDTANNDHHLQEEQLHQAEAISRQEYENQYHNQTIKRKEPYKASMSHATKSGTDPHLRGKHKGWNKNLLSSESDASSTSNTRSKINVPICTDCLRPLVLEAPSSKDTPLNLEPDDPNLENVERSRFSNDVGRPWALRCGHVVCSQCMQTARDRYRRSLEHGNNNPNGNDRNNNPSHTLPTPPFSSSSMTQYNSENTMISDSSFDVIENPLPRRYKHGSDKSKITANDNNDKELNVDMGKPRLNNNKNNNSSNNNNNHNNNSNTKRKTRSEGKLKENEPSSSSPSPSKKQKTTKKLNSLLNFDPITTDTKRQHDVHVNHNWIKCPVVSCDGGSESHILASNTEGGPWELFV